MSNNKFITTPQGLKDLESELEERMTITRDKIADEIARAREQGDLSENAAYSAAMESKQFNETRISELEDLIKNAVVKEINSKDSKAGIGEKVKIKRLDDNKEFVYQLVGENESNPSEGKISIKSPIGSAIIGKKVGENIEINLPTGVQKYKLVSIN